MFMWRSSGGDVDIKGSLLMVVFVWGVGDFLEGDAQETVRDIGRLDVERAPRESDGCTDEEIKEREGEI